MADDLKQQLGNWWSGLRKKAVDTAAQQGAGFVRGKIASRDVTDEAGNILVGAGARIDDAAIERVLAAGKMPALVAAAATAQTQDLRDKIIAEYERTPEGQGARNLADSEDYLEARQYIRYTAALEVTDVRGNVLVPAGKVIEDEDVRKVRDAGQLAALIYSAQQSGPPTNAGTPVPPVQTTPKIVPPSRRTAVPLAETFDEKEDEKKKEAK